MVIFVNEFIIDIYSLIDLSQSKLKNLTVKYSEKSQSPQGVVTNRVNELKVCPLDMITINYIRVTLNFFFSFSHGSAMTKHSIL